MMPFHIPHLTGREKESLEKLLLQKRFSGEGPQNQLLRELLERYFSAPLVVLTPSCTAALELAFLLIGICPGDEVILPSFTFSSTATAITLLGGVPVFVDVHPETLTINENLIERAIGPKSKAICPVHYAGVSCNMDAINAIAKRHKLLVVEDAAQGIGSQYKAQKIGQMGDFAAFSFHESKNIHCGEGGALLINNEYYLKAALMARDKGTNRQQMIDGSIDKYTWMSKGSSYLFSEFQAAFLNSQISDLAMVSEIRNNLHAHYRLGLEKLESEQKLSCLKVPEDCEGNGHIFGIILQNSMTRRSLQDFLKFSGIESHSHYTPLHLSPAGLKMGRLGSTMDITESMADRLLRLPIHTSMTVADVSLVVKNIEEYFRTKTV